MDRQLPQASWSAFRILLARFAHEADYSAGLETKLREVLGIPHRPSSCLRAIAEWRQGDRNAQQRIEKMVRRLIQDSIFLDKTQEMNYQRKHYYQDLAQDLKVELRDATPQTVEQVTVPMARFLQMPPLFTLYQVKYHALKSVVRWADYCDFEDEVLVHRINRVLRPCDEYEIWPLIVVLVFEGSQTTVVDLYLRERTPSDTENFVFEPRGKRR